MLVALFAVGASSTAAAVDLVPMYGGRWGGTLANHVEPYVTGAPSSFSVASSEAYGAVVDVPVYGDLRALELYVSHQPTALQGGDYLSPPIRDFTVNILHVGLVDSVQDDNDPRLSWLLIGTGGATELSGGGQRDTRFSIGLGGGVRWMVSPHVGLRGDLRGLITFANGSAAIVCSGGCVGHYEGSVVVQGEVTVGVVVRF